MAGSPFAFSDSRRVERVRSFYSECSEPPAAFRVPSLPFGNRGFRRSGFARRGEKIAKAIERRDHTPFWLLVATGEISAMKKVHLVSYDHCNVKKRRNFVVFRRFRHILRHLIKMGKSISSFAMIVGHQGFLT